VKNVYVYECDKSFKYTLNSSTSMRYKLATPIGRVLSMLFLLARYFRKLKTLLKYSRYQKYLIINY